MKIIKKASLMFVGIVLSLIILEIGLQMAGFTLNTIKKYKNKIIKDPNTITILCLGESTTDDQWPPILQTILDEKSKDKKFKVIDEGHAGKDTKYLINQIIDKKLKIYNPDIIVSMMGINDNNETVKQLKSFKLKTISLIHLVLENIKELYKQKDFNYYIEKAKCAHEKEQYEEEIEIYKYLNKNYPEEKLNFIVYEIMAYKYRPLEDLKVVIFDLIKLDPYICIQEVLYFLCETKNIELFKRIFLMDPHIDEKIKEHLFWFMIYKKNIEKLGIKELVKKIDKQIQNISSNNFVDNINFFSEEQRIYGYCLINNIINNNNNEYKKGFDILTKFYTSNIFPNTVYNYRNLAKICKKNHIKLIAMQYPLRSLKPLKHMLADFNEITFISNNENFKQIFKTHKLDDVFTDIFGGDFGHCTELGNTLIAENVAETILKLYN